MAEAERTKRIEAEKLLALERSYSAQLLSKIDVRDRRLPLQLLLARQQALARPVPAPRRLDRAW